MLSLYLDRSSTWLTWTLVMFVFLFIFKSRTVSHFQMSYVDLPKHINAATKNNWYAYACVTKHWEIKIDKEHFGAEVWSCNLDFCMQHAIIESWACAGMKALKAAGPSAKCLQQVEACLAIKQLGVAHLDPLWIPPSANDRRWSHCGDANYLEHLRTEHESCAA